MTALSDTQREALALAADHGGTLVRLPGGFWTWDGCPVESRPWGDVPTEWARTNTVKALVKRGALVETEHRQSRAISGTPHEFAVAVAIACHCMTEDPGDGLGERVVTHSGGCHLHPEHV